MSVNEPIGNATRWMMSNCQQRHQGGINAISHVVAPNNYALTLQFQSCFIVLFLWILSTLQPRLVIHGQNITTISGESCVVFNRHIESFCARNNEIKMQSELLTPAIWAGISNVTDCIWAYVLLSSCQLIRLFYIHIHTAFTLATLCSHWKLQHSSAQGWSGNPETMNNDSSMLSIIRYNSATTAATAQCCWLHVLCVTSFPLGVCILTAIHRV